MELEGTFCRGTTCRTPELEEAHQDKLVRKMAGAIAHANDLEGMLFYAVAATMVGPDPKFLGPKRHRMSPADKRTADLIDSISGDWHKTLTADAVGYRKGAFVEQLVARLLEARMPAADVHPEKKVILSDGNETSHFDVVGANVSLPWEGIECKLPSTMSEHRAKELSWAAQHAADIEDRLMVIVASAANSTTLLEVLRSVLDCPQLIYFVAAESFSTLGKPAPRYTVSAA
jgi:hypothetical protein